MYWKSRTCEMSRLRVVFLAENLPFPGDTRAYSEATALSEYGAEVSVICPKNARNDAGFEMVDGICVYRYWQPWRGTGMLTYAMEYGWAMACSFAIMLWIFMRHGFDVVHAANPPDVLWIPALPFLALGKQFVFDQHALCPELLDLRLTNAVWVKRLLLLFEQISCRLATLVIVTNQSAYDIALERGESHEKLCIVRDGPDLNRFIDVAKRPELKAGAKYLAVYVGTLASQNGIDRILSAASYIVHERNRRDVQFAIVGDGDCLGDLQSLALALGIEQYVRFPGWIDGSEFQAYLATADVCLAPEPPHEFNRRSSFIKLTEYMRYGKATVTFDLLESRRTLGPAGIYVDQDNLRRFGSAILGILDDPERRLAIGETAKQRLRSGFHWGLSKRALIEAYDAVVVKGSRRSVARLDWATRVEGSLLTDSQARG